MRSLETFAAAFVFVAQFNSLDLTFLTRHGSITVFVMETPAYFPIPPLKISSWKTYSTGYRRSGRSVRD